MQMHWSLLPSRSTIGRRNGKARRNERLRKDVSRLTLAILVGAVALLAAGPLASAQAAGTASLSGKVTAVKGGNLEGIEVTATGTGGFGTTTTGAGGTYTIAGGQLGGGTYTVSFVDPDEIHVSTEKSTTLTEGANTELNVALMETGSLSGTVTSAASGAGLADVNVFIEEGETFRSAFTDGTGHYTLGRLAPGTYTLEFSPGSDEYVAQDGQATVTEGGAVVANAALKQGGKISGRVTDTYSHNGLAKIGVTAFSSTGGSGFAKTNENGEYTITGLSSGSYKLGYFWEFSDAEEKAAEKAPRLIPKYITQYFNGQPSAATANTVGASEGSNTSGINVAMVPSAPVNAAAPTVSGTPTVGSPLACSNGSWTGELLSLSVGWPLTTPFTYQWLRNGTPIAGSTSPSYLVQAADLGHGLECEVTATIEAGRASAKSAPFAVALPVPVLTTSSSQLRVSKNAAAVSIKCASAACAGSGRLVQTVITKRRKGKRTVTKKTTLVIATGTYSLAAGKSGTLTLRLTKAGAKKLAAAHRLSPKLLVSVTGGKRLEKTVRLLAGVAKKKRK
jgi:Carboxypeptidase regulatory-like domain